MGSEISILDVMTTRKTYSSLNKVRSRGVIPQNLLNIPVQRISVPTIDMASRGVQTIVKPLNMDEEDRSTDAKNCFFMSLNLEEYGLTSEPYMSFDVKLMEYNGTPKEGGDLRLLVLARKDHIFLRSGRCFVDKMIIPFHALKEVYFSTDSSSILFVLQKDFGYWKMELSGTWHKLFSFIRDGRDEWVSEALTEVALETFEVILGRERKRREDAQKDPVIVTRHIDRFASQVKSFTPQPSSLLASDLPSELEPPEQSPSTKESLLPSATLSAVNSLRITRSQKLSSDQRWGALPNTTVDLSSSNSPIDEGLEAIDEAQETPEPFYPPLRYAVTSSKKFTITANDFKTLYNASWVNDTLIDFFIAYEIEQAITKLGTMQRSEIHAFNSFFHTKLTSTNGDEEPQYYENIRKWLEKLDLMSFQYIVIPIMENSHWFCIVIKGLPNLLSYAQRDAETGSLTSPDNYARQFSAGSSYRVFKEKVENAVCEIFVLDSLRLTHPKLTEPIKVVLKAHCKERHGVFINANLIKIRASRVPRQQNYSDCGVHVIYNLKKWLEEPAICELMWKKRSVTNRAYFEGQDRGTMRKKCIDILLKLHEQQPKEDATASNSEQQLSEDEIEEISYHHSRPDYCEGSKDTEPIASSGLEGEAAAETSSEQMKTEVNANLEEKVDLDTFEKEELEEELAEEGEGRKREKERESSDNDKETNTKATAERYSGMELAAPDSLADSALSNLANDSHLSHINDEPDTEFSKLILDQFYGNLVGKQSAADLKDPNLSFQISSSEDISTETVTSFAKGRTGGTPYRFKTLDPRTERNRQSSFPKKRFEIYQIEHPQIRRQFFGTKLENSTIKYLNDTFVNHDKVYNEGRLESIVEFVNVMENCKPSGQDILESVKAEISAFLKEPAAPMDAPFVINEADESRELNRSVGDLKIQDEGDSSSDEILQAPLRRSCEIFQVLLHRVVHSVSHSSFRNSSEDDSDVEVIAERLSSPTQRIMRREARTKMEGTEQNLQKIEIVPDFEDDCASIGPPVKQRDFDWSSPKRRRLDRTL